MLNLPRCLRKCIIGLSCCSYFLVLFLINKVIHYYLDFSLNLATTVNLHTLAINMTKATRRIAPAGTTQTSSTIATTVCILRQPTIIFNWY